VSTKGGYRFDPIACLGYDLHIPLGIYLPNDSRTHQGMVINYEHPDCV
jgi:hypothetical protein